LTDAGISSSGGVFNKSPSLGDFYESSSAGGIFWARDMPCPGDFYKSLSLILCLNFSRFFAFFRGPKVLCHAFFCSGGRNRGKIHPRRFFPDFAGLLPGVFANPAVRISSRETPVTPLFRESWRLSGVPGRVGIPTSAEAPKANRQFKSRESKVCGTDGNPNRGGSSSDRSEPSGRF
jgi:hypothetical protein